MVPVSKPVLLQNFPWCLYKESVSLGHPPTLPIEGRRAVTNQFLHQYISFSCLLDNTETWMDEKGGYYENHLLEIFEYLKCKQRSGHFCSLEHRWRSEYWSVVQLFHLLHILLS